LSCGIDSISFNQDSIPFHLYLLVIVHPEMVDFGFRQGPSEFSTAGIARYFED
jgi:hypothetical protein